VIGEPIVVPVVVDPIPAALAAIRGIGLAWRASEQERERLDFKETPDTALSGAQRRQRNLSDERKRFMSTLAETAVCLANTHGGVIVVGVRDRASTREEALQGVDAAHYSVEHVRIAIHRSTSPPLTVDVHEHQEDAARLLLIRVPRGTVVHGTTSGVFKHRVGDQCLPLGGTSLRDLQAVRGQYDWSAELTNHGPEAVSPASIARGAELLRLVGADDQAELAERDPEQFLSNVTLLRGGKLTRAGLLLYGRGDAIRQVVGDWGVLLTTAESPGSEGSVLLRREDAQKRSLIQLIDDVLARLGAVATVETIRVGASEVRLVDYPEDVVRELAANAFAHRDWEQAGVIEISHSMDELVISSPGSLLPTLDPARLLRETAQRNPLLSQEIARLRIAEGAGLGFDRVWRTLASIGKEPPAIDAGPRFIVTVHGGRGDKAFARFLRGPSFPDHRLATDLDVLLVLSLLRGRRTVTAALVAPAIQRDEPAAGRVLRRMQDALLVEPTTGTARRQSPTYRLTPATRAALRGALTYRGESTDSDDLKLVRHLKRHRRITNEDVRNYLDCDVPTARNRLTRLRSKGLIEFATTSPRRGPNVEYVATSLVDDFDGA
jgi:ATP-dependent DNA helicase RecG